MRSARLLGLAGLATLLGGTAPAAAEDRVSGTRSELLVEREHVATISLDRGLATMVVRRTVDNGGPRHDQAKFWIDVPASGVATGLRTRGGGDGKQWFTAQLLEAEAAAAKYRELTGIGGYYPKDPALLSWRHAGLLLLQVFPVAPREQKMIEYTMVLPTEYRGGRDHLRLPAMGTARLRATVSARPARDGDRVFAGEDAIAPGGPVRMDRAGDVDLSLERASAPRIGGALGVVPLAAGRTLLGQRIEMAPRLSAIPHGADVVVVVDASRSLDADDAAAEVAVARSYLSHFAGTGAQAEVVLFNRRVSPMHGALVSAEQALADLEGLTVGRKNGSRLDEALARAAGILERSPRLAPRRILILSDARVRVALGPEKLRKLAAATGALVHVGVIGIGEPGLSRDDEHAWAGVVRPTGGLVWSAHTIADASHASEARRVFEELARPVRLDRLSVRAKGLDSAAFGYPERLDEGEGYADLRVVEQRPGFLTISGELWSRPVSAVLTADPGEGRRDAALVFGSSALGGLTEPEMMTLARIGHAVSPVTSLLAVEPGVRPSTEGLESGVGEGGGGRGQGIALGSIGTIGHGASSYDPVAALRAALEPGWRACGGAGHKGTITLETTLLEVVEVSDAEADASTRSPLARCLEEAAWEVEVPLAFRPTQGSFVINL